MIIVGLQFFQLLINISNIIIYRRGVVISIMWDNLQFTFLFIWREQVTYKSVNLD